MVFKYKKEHCDIISHNNILYYYNSYVIIQFNYLLNHTLLSGFTFHFLISNFIYRLTLLKKMLLFYLNHTHNYKIY